MFEQLLPIEMEREIWKHYRSMYVFPEIRDQKPIWVNPSEKLLEICKDVGCIQHGHSEMDKTLFSNGTWFSLKYNAYVQCFSSLCTRCVFEGFPCNDSIFYGSMNPMLRNQWNMEFYESKLHENEKIEISAGYI